MRAAGGLLLVPVALVFDPPIPMPTGTNVLGLAWLGLIGAGLTYFLWFRGISRLEPTVVSLLGFLSPGTAVLLGWLFLDQTLSALQIIGVLLVIGSIWLGQRSNRTPRARIACRKSPCPAWHRPIVSTISDRLVALRRSKARDAAPAGRASRGQRLQSMPTRSTLL